MEVNSCLNLMLNSDIIISVNYDLLLIIQIIWKSYLQLPSHPSLPFHPWAPGPRSPLWGPEALANLALLLHQTDLFDPKI
jgi:hypothetical protein